LNIGLDMHQRIYIVDENFVANKIEVLMRIQGEIGKCQGWFILWLKTR